MRLAFLSQASLQRREITAQTNWRSAVREAGDRLGPLVILLNLADTWQRTQDKEDLLWHVYERLPRERWALRELSHAIPAEGNTRGLNKAVRRAGELDPKTPGRKNNLAGTSFCSRSN